MPTAIKIYCCHHSNLNPAINYIFDKWKYCLLIDQWYLHSTMYYQVSNKQNPMPLPVLNLPLIRVTCVKGVTITASHRQMRYMFLHWTKQINKCLFKTPLLKFNYNLLNIHMVSNFLKYTYFYKPAFVCLHTHSYIHFFERMRVYGSR